AASYVLHEHLEQHNDPLYFHEFVHRAAQHGLGYLGEADVAAMVPATFPPAVQHFLDRVSADQVHLEQYMDFLCNRMFRQTLLCRADRYPNYELAAERVTSLHLASPVRPSGACDLRPEVAVEFLCPGDVTIASHDPLAKAALLILAQTWPGSLPLGR